MTLPRLWVPGLDPQLDEFQALFLHDLAWYPDITAVGITEGRRIASMVRRRWNVGGREMAETVEIRSGPVPMRIYRPGPGARPALVYLHGGGWVFLDLDTHDRIMREHAARTGFSIVGLDYPRAPETTFPHNIFACVEAIEWLAANAASLNLLPDCMMMAGDSAGANLALAALLLLRASHHSPVRAAALYYGVYDQDLTRPSYLSHGTTPGLFPAARMAWYWDRYCPSPESRLDALASPLRADLSGLPPIYTVTAGLDALHDEGVALAEALAASGNGGTGVLVPEAQHGFLEAISMSAKAAKTLDDACTWMLKGIGMGAGRCR